MLPFFHLLLRLFAASAELVAEAPSTVHGRSRGQPSEKNFARKEIVMNLRLWPLFRPTDSSAARVQSRSRVLAKRPQRTLGLETLEGRLMMSGGIVLTDVSNKLDSCGAGAITSNGAL